MAKILRSKKNFEPTYRPCALPPWRAETGFFLVRPYFLLFRFAENFMIHLATEVGRQKRPLDQVFIHLLENPSNNNKQTNKNVSGKVNCPVSRRPLGLHRLLDVPSPDAKYWDTQSVLVGVWERPHGKHFFTSFDFTFATFTQALSHEGITCVLRGQLW